MLVEPASMSIASTARGVGQWRRSEFVGTTVIQTIARQEFDDVGILGPHCTQQLLMELLVMLHADGVDMLLSGQAANVAHFLSAHPELPNQESQCSQGEHQVESEEQRAHDYPSASTTSEAGAAAWAAASIAVVGLIAAAKRAARGAIVLYASAAARRGLKA